MNVEQSRLVSLQFDLPGDVVGGRLGVNISGVNFVPDEMIVRSVLFKDDGTHNELNELVWLDGPTSSASAIANFIDGMPNAPQSRIQITGPVKGAYTFQTYSDGDVDNALAGKLGVMLEFIRYKRPAAGGRDDESITVFTPLKDRLIKPAVVKTH